MRTHNGSSVRAGDLKATLTPTSGNTLYPTTAVVCPVGGTHVAGTNAGVKLGPGATFGTI